MVARGRLQLPVDFLPAWLVLMTEVRGRGFFRSDFLLRRVEVLPTSSAIPPYIIVLLREVSRTAFEKRQLPHSEPIAYGDSEDSPGILLRGCSSWKRTVGVSFSLRYKKSYPSRKLEKADSLIFHLFSEAHASANADAANALLCQSPEGDCRGAFCSQQARSNPLACTRTPFLRSPCVTGERRMECFSPTETGPISTLLTFWHFSGD
ncbi:hypothetical protein PO909_023030 [Leuciscus waleckii]